MHVASRTKEKEDDNAVTRRNRATQLDHDFIITQIDCTDMPHH